MGVLKLALMLIELYIVSQPPANIVLHYGLVERKDVLRRLFGAILVISILCLYNNLQSLLPPVTQRSWSLLRTLQ